MKTGFIVFAHGSSVEAANDGVRTLAGELAHAGGFDLVEAAFLGPGTPDLETAAGALAARGAAHIVILPYFLTLGVHLERDLPRIAGELARIHKGVEIELTPPLEGHPLLLPILLDRARHALEDGENRVGRIRYSQAAPVP